MWELVLPALERRHEVLAVTLPGHAGGAPLGEALDGLTLARDVEAAMDEAGFSTAHVVGSSLGGYLALQLASRGRARSVVALSPAGGWARSDRAHRRLLQRQRDLHAQAEAAAPFADTLLSTTLGRRRATELVSVNFEHIPKDLLVHQLMGIAACAGAEQLIEHGLREAWELDAANIDCPVRIVWGAADKLLPWPDAAVRYREQWLPQADWVVLDDVGHYPQVDLPLETAELILGFTATGRQLQGGRTPHLKE